MILVTWPTLWKLFNKRAPQSKQDDDQLQWPMIYTKHVFMDVNKSTTLEFDTHSLEYLTF